MEDVLLIHSGAGSDRSYNPRLERYAHESFRQSGALDSVVEAVRMMEDDPDFNAGTGSVKRIDGTIQMDAAVMMAGSIGSVVNIERVKNPILVARAVMEKTPHVMLSGDGAVAFARRIGYEDYDPSTPRTEELYRKALKILSGTEKDIPERYASYMKYAGIFGIPENKDTVGAVARVSGKFAAAVSTGGSSPMMRGRVGDSPIPGAGLFAGEKGAVVATGIGEEIMRRSLCYSIYHQIGTENLEDIIKREIDGFNGVLAGVIAITRDSYASYSNSSMAVGVYRFGNK